MDFDLTEKELLVQNSARQFTAHVLEPAAQQIAEEGKLPDDLITKAAQLGFLGMMVPSKYGGNNAGHLSYVLAVEQMAYVGSGAWWLVGMNNSVAWCIARFGSEEVKQACLPELCDGTGYASIQFTEEETGSDPAALKTIAVPQGGSYVINGMKRFSTFGARNGYAMLFTKDDTGGCTAFVIRKNVPGYTTGPLWRLMGSGGMEAYDVYLDGLTVPAERTLGQKGAGFNILLEWIAVEKVAQCASCVGIAQAALDESVKYAGTRRSRGKPVSAMQGIRWMLADMKCRLEAARWLTYRAAFVFDRNMPAAGVDAATAKLFVVPATIESTEMARRIHGAYGYTKELKIERLYREILGATAIATSLEINRSLVGSSLVR